MSANPPQPCPCSWVAVRVLSGSLQGKEVTRIDPAPRPLPPEGLWLGRGDAEGQTLLAFEEPMVLERHAALVRQGEEIVLVVRGQTFLHPQGQPLQGVLPLPAGTVLPIQLGVNGPVCVVKVGLAVPFGRYLVVGEIGEGGMGVVYQAIDRPPRAVDGRLVALKMITRRHREVDPHAQQRFLLESSILYQLDHPHVVRIFEAKEEEDAVYIAMEYLRGVSLKHLALQFRRQRRLLPPAVAAAVMSQVCEGLHAVHELHSSDGTPHSIVHRDVSPSNIIVTSRGVVKLIDFGIVRAQGALHQTHSGALIGKPSYMAPEQIPPRVMSILVGQAPPEPVQIDRRVDIFAAGVILWELLAGCPLFYRNAQEQGNILPTLTAVQECRVPSLGSHVPGALRAIVSRALSRLPQARQPTAQVLAEELRAVVQQEAPHLLDPGTLAEVLTTQLGSNLSEESPEGPRPLAMVPSLLRTSLSTQTQKHASVPPPPRWSCCGRETRC